MSASNAVNIADLRAVARRRLPDMAFDYVDGGAEDETGLERNIEAFRQVGIVPHFLVDVSERSQETELFGKTYGSPFGIAPTGMNNMSWPGGDRALACAARDANIPFVLSTAASSTIEEIAAEIPGQFWFQLYAPTDKSASEDLLRRAADAGANGLMVTVDVPIAAKRERDIRNKLAMPLRFTGRHILDFARHPHWLMQMLRQGTPQFANLAPYADVKAKGQSLAAYITSQISSALDWDSVDWLRKSWKGPLVIKGLMSASDAVRAADAGVDGILLSNHGARQFDAGPSTIELLPAVREAVGDRLTIMLDSGVRRGGDIAKAIALGADFVFVGRAAVYGVAAYGPAGAARAIEILRDELDRFLGQSGCCNIAGLKIAEVRTEFPTARTVP